MTQTIACKFCGAMIRHHWQFQDHARCTPPLLVEASGPGDRRATRRGGVLFDDLVPRLPRVPPETPPTPRATCEASAGEDAAGGVTAATGARQVL
jgi:hypothetical protein